MELTPSQTIVPSTGTVTANGGPNREGLRKLAQLLKAELPDMNTWWATSGKYAGRANYTANEVLDWYSKLANQKVSKLSGYIELIYNLSLIHI